MLPALIFFRIWIFSQNHKISWKESLIKNKFVVSLISILFLSSIAYIKLANVAGPGYAGVDQDTFSIQNYINILNKNDFKLAIAINLICFLASRFGRQVRSFINGYLILSLLIIIPQIFLYSKSGLDAHYYLPISIGVAFLIVYPLKKIRECPGLGYKLLSLVLIPSIILRIGFEVAQVDQYFHKVSAYTSSLHDVMVQTSQCVGRESKFIILANPYTNFEMISALQLVMDHVVKNDQFYLATYGSQNSDFIINTMRAEETRWYFLNPNIFDKIYANHRMTSLNLQELNNVAGVLVTNTSKVEKVLGQNTQLKWFRSDQFTREYNKNTDFSLYCKNGVS
jgi:hypothetical protein